LPRVGPVLAARIVAYRREHGSFRAAADLQGVPGIGPRTAARLAPLLRFD
jgi:competence protein ComEA